nr:MAG TPA: hypothetical protein [Caudoviricetes sp.]
MPLLFTSEPLQRRCKLRCKSVAIIGINRPKQKQKSTNNRQSKSRL